MQINLVLMDSNYKSYSKLPLAELN